MSSVSCCGTNQNAKRPWSRLCVISMEVSLRTKIWASRLHSKTERTTEEYEGTLDQE